MKKLENALPFVLLVSFLALSHYKQPQIADSIITLALCALCGYKYYLNYKEQPDYLDIFRKELSEKDREIKDLQTSIGMHNVAKQKRQQVNEVQW